MLRETQGEFERFQVHLDDFREFFKAQQDTKEEAKKAAEAKMAAEAEEARKKNQAERSIERDPKVLFNRILLSLCFILDLLHFSPNFTFYIGS